ncbi:hypothetical protein Cni_G00376 [Canna indica]|uniref:Uncharacterized protein n=1 Tax=Canna indica TaxID=4628 RepID=A0AAQ3JMD4_9LILI|nr:hypothetical protein Cni_G00376 [Canna indica]
MNRHKYHNASANIPFSRENQPGFSKVVAPKGKEAALMTASTPEHVKLLLPPPPGKSESPRMAAHGLHLPLPPSMLFQQLPSSRSSPKKGFKKEDDPFLAAYLECTKGRRASRVKKRDSLLGLISCKSSSGVSENAKVRLSQLPR